MKALLSAGFVHSVVGTPQLDNAPTKSLRENRGEGRYRRVASAVNLELGASSTYRTYPLTVSRNKAGRAQRIASIQEAFDACDVRDGAVLSFHHHLRNGDAVMQQVLSEAAERGLHDLGVAASSVFPVHTKLAELIGEGIVTRLWTAYMRGPVADVISAGRLENKAIFQSHGSRAQALQNGRIPIDVAFIGAPVADSDGALTGAFGAAACGPLGYPMVDALYAKNVVALAQEIHPGPLPRCEIPASHVDYLVKVSQIGDPKGIISGTTRVAFDATSLRIAKTAAAVIDAAGHVRSGMSFQTGAGGASLATVVEVGKRMRRDGVRGSFIAGGICGTHVGLVKDGLFELIHDVQCFDLEAVSSYLENDWHRAMSASEYASPLCPNCVASRLDVVVLGAAEIDQAFNVNVLTAGNGNIIGGPGGHPDTAAGSKLSVVTTRLTGGGYPKVVDRVTTITTPGAAIDVLVTDEGVAVNPRRVDVARDLEHAGLPVVSIEKLLELARSEQSRKSTRREGPVVAVIEDRHGNVMDEIRGDISV